MADISKINIKNEQYDIKDNIARSHIANTSNPHGVTAAQVGAATPAEVNAAVRKAAPRNLLDNSDFTNPVAQAGIGGNHGTVAYAADRWILDSGTVSYSAGVGLTLSGTIRQKLEFQPTGQTSAFVGVASGEASISYADGAVTITSSGGVIQWAALYAGEYTAETLPEYKPKGYSAELVECQRYYQVFKSTVVMGLMFNGSRKVLLPVYPKIPMRVTPSVILDTPTWVRGTGQNVTSIPTYTINTYCNNPYSPVYEIVFNTALEIADLNACAFLCTYELNADL